ncbi:peptidase S41-like protein [Stenotrophomonas maltophilia]|uniref:S41 family peptidase n=1 Tax=Stenotrophomonas chelatiphaga TaxID=517011 RepID=UPI000F4CB874|nr:S41 family peptidase [Stenotrophomonas chelatiphaga]MCS4230036.1 hypothetical protein [Stenotrophomonas chelatiphaga]ROQ45741.1 peptidase S41-like protein [Stenotrophomonas maltophilia]
MAGRCAWVVAMMLVPAVAQAVDVPSAESLAKMLDLMEQRALYREAVDWTLVRADVAGAHGDPARVRAVLDAAIQRSSKGHGRWVAAGSVQPPAQLNAVPGAGAAAGRGGLPATLDRRLGWVAVDRFSPTLASTPAEQARQSVQRAVALQQRLRDADSSPRCGWVVDLRNNSGGNMWPMLLGVEPLLRIPGDGIQVLGMLRGAGPNVPWESHDGTLMAKGRPMLGFGQPGYRLREPGGPVAVLVGERTASSGEAIALAFRGRPDTRSFGAPTAGFATSNSSIRLPDGTLFLLTDTLMADRNGVGDGGPIVPDQVTDGEAATLAAAHRWLLSQPGCVAQAKAAPRAG